MTVTIATAPSTIATRIGFLIEFPPLSRPKKQGALGHAPQVSSKRPRDAERRYKSRFVRGTVTYQGDAAHSARAERRKQHRMGGTPRRAGQPTALGTRESL